MMKIKIINKNIKKLTNVCFRNNFAIEKNHTKEIKCITKV